MNDLEVIKAELRTLRAVTIDQTALIVFMMEKLLDKDRDEIMEMLRRSREISVERDSDNP